MVKTSGRKLDDVYCMVCGEPANCSSSIIGGVSEYRCSKHYEEYCKAHGVVVK